MVEVTVTVGDAHGIESVASALREAGMDVRSVLPAIGIIVGSCPDRARSALLAVTGVDAVEEAGRTFRG